MIDKILAEQEIHFLKLSILKPLITNQMNELIRKVGMMNYLSSKGFSILCTSAVILWLCLIGGKTSAATNAHCADILNQKMSADIDVRGEVKDVNGEPLPGVNITLKGTFNGTTTDALGKYAIKAPEDGELVFTYIGFVNQVIAINRRSVINVKMEAETKALGEVVVVGYATQKKVSVTGAVSQIKGTDLVKRTTSNVQQALQGQVSGVTIIDQGAGPGKSNMVMRVRGITTLGNNDALVIVDGIEQRIADINPDDIETVSVLKDAASTAIYGSRAANGVILITTKRAKSEKVSVSYSGYYAIQKSANNPVHMGLEAYMRLQNIAYNNSFGAPIYSEATIQEYINATDRLKYPLPNTWFDAVLSPAPQLYHSLAVAGGSEKVKARLSLRYQDQDGIIANSGSKISEIRLNTDYTISPKISIATDINYRFSNTLSPINENAVFTRMLQTSQWTVPKYPDGTYGISSDGHNPLLYAEAAGTSRLKNDLLTGNIKADWTIVKGLKFSTQIAASITSITGKNYTNSYEVLDYYNPKIIRKAVPINSLLETRNSSREITMNNLLTYSLMAHSHSFNILTGYSQIENVTNNLSAFRQGFYNNSIQSIGVGTNDGTKSNDGNEATWGLRSYFSRLNYAYKEKYLIEANARYDGSSRFVGNNRYSFFPSFSAGWRISEEPIWRSIGVDKVINELKFRGSWGKTGNQAVGLYTGLVTLNPSTYSFGGTPVQGYQQQTLANKDISWETTTQANLGLDAQLLNNRLSISIDYYHKKTNDILLLLPVPGTLGLNPTYQNAGRMDNKGWEFLIESRNNFGKFGLNGNLIFNINNNKVIDLAGTGPYITGGLEDKNIVGEGYPYGAYWGYKTDGLFQTQDQVNSYPNFRPGTAPGDVKVVDLNGDGKITPNDMTYLGLTFPKYTFGSSLNLTYKGFALNLLFQGIAGSKTRLGGAIFQMGVWGGFTHELITNNYWTPEHPDARFPRPVKFDTRNDDMFDRSLVSAAYLRLKNVQLLYKIPSLITSKLRIKGMSVYVATTNLLTFASFNEWNLDPETPPGTRAERYPQTSVSTVGTNIQF
ncbi:SusC/RagA family TonB-linked outer membrane protein [Spirosoma areae]